MELKERISKKAAPGIERTCQICQMRLARRSTEEIAKEFDISRQRVFQILQGLSLPKDGRSPRIPRRPEKLSDEQMMDICRYRINGMPVKEIAKTMNVSADDVCQTLRFVSGSKRKGKWPRKDYYPAIVEWMQRHDMTTPELAKLTGIPKSRLANSICGANGVTLSKADADRLAKVTGLKLREIYAVQLRNLAEKKAMGDANV